MSTSCKDLSKLSPSFQRNHPVLSLQTSPGGSADTWQGLLSYLDAHQCSALFYENSDALEDSHSAEQGNGNMDVFVSELTSRSMEGQCFILNSKLFGLPHNRRRFYGAFFLLPSGPNESGLSIDVEGGRSLSDTFQTLKAFVQVCQRRPPPAREVLLPDGHKDVQDELWRRITVESTEPERSWVAEHQQLYNLLRLPWGVDPMQPSTKASQWYSTLTRYQQSALVLHQYRLFLSQPTSTAIGQPISAQVPKLMIDLHPNASRAASTSIDDNGAEIAPCILPSQLMWLHLPMERLMTGTEALLFQGFPLEQLPPTCGAGSNRLRQDLAGNAVSLPVMLALVLSSVHAVTWRSPRDANAQKRGDNGQNPPPQLPQAPSQDEVDDAMALFESL